MWEVRTETHRRQNSNAHAKGGRVCGITRSIAKFVEKRRERPALFEGRRFVTISCAGELRDSSSYVMVGSRPKRRITPHNT
jgi:hypothetical protein